LKNIKIYFGLLAQDDNLAVFAAENLGVALDSVTQPFSMVTLSPR